MENISEKMSEKRKIKQIYKIKMEESIDNIGRLSSNSKQNGYENYEISKDLISPIVRYYRNYWIKDMSLILLGLTFFIFISSFYTVYATLVLTGAFCLMYAYNEDFFMMKYFKILDISNFEIYDIRDVIFLKKYKLINNVILWITVSIISFVTNIFSPLLPNVFLNWDFDFSFLNFLGNEFIRSNEIYAYVNVFLMLLILFLRRKKFI
ncbi:hypothetical protein [Aliarcobacter butzleri]|uniref:hypothetical protein n=1 Tax=Aliarcobacter butzleri TaxID=28197 RepID=UPI000F482715|nr:hypothetical protein [Aliarcobacter butzleri]